VSAKPVEPVSNAVPTDNDAAPGEQTLDTDNNTGTLDQVFQTLQNPDVNWFTVSEDISNALTQQ